VASRIIRSHGGSYALLDALASLFILEAMQPGTELYLISPWLSNSRIIENSYGRVGQVFPFLNGDMVYLADFLSTCAWRGCKVRLICNPEHRITMDFIRSLGANIETRVLTDNHEKGLIGSHFYIHGSMNFTYHGIYINGESVRITTDTAEVNSALLSARMRWEESEAI